MAKIFVSHSSKDKDLVDAFVDKILRLGCKVPKEEIFCSSKESMKTRPGEDWIKDLKSRMQDATILILLLSPNYYDSVYCLAELGASWVLDRVKVFPILVPPITVGKAEGLVQELQVGMITDDEHLDTLREVVSEEFGIPIKDLADWRIQRVTFVDQVENIIHSIPEPSRVRVEELRRAQERADVYKSERDQANSKISHLEKLIEELKKTKDAEEVAEVIFENLDEAAQFEELESGIRQTLHKLPPVVQRTLYFNNKGEGMSVRQGQSRDSVDDAVDRGFICWSDQDQGYNVVTDDAVIRSSLAQIEKLDRFLQTVDEQFHASFESSYGYRADLRNIRFWEECLFW